MPKHCASSRGERGEAWHDLTLSPVADGRVLSSCGSCGALKFGCRRLEQFASRPRSWCPNGGGFHTHIVQAGKRHQSYCGALFLFVDLWLVTLGNFPKGPLGGEPKSF